MKNWSTTTKWMVGLLALVLIAWGLYANWDSISSMWETTPDDETAGNRVAISRFPTSTSRTTLINQILEKAPANFAMNLGRANLERLTTPQLQQIISYLSGNITETQLKNTLVVNSAVGRTAGLCEDGWRCGSKCVGFWGWIFCSE